MIDERTDLPVQRTDLPDPTITTGWPDWACWLYIAAVAVIFGGFTVFIILDARP